MKEYWKSQGILSEEKSGNPVHTLTYTTGLEIYR